MTTMKRLGAFAAVTCGLLALGGPAQAAVQLDQYSMPESGVVAGSGGAGAGGVSDRNRLGQSFTVGLDGTLEAIDLGIFRYLDGVTSGFTFDLYGDDAAPLVSGAVSGADIPAFFLHTTDWASALRLDLSAAGLRVHAGEQLSLLIGRDAAPAPTGPSWLFIVDGHWITYAGGNAIVETGGVRAPQAEDFAFRTYVDTATAAPEPGTWALLIAGFALAGAALRRRAATAPS
jgi:hypothetical protein